MAARPSHASSVCHQGPPPDQMHSTVGETQTERNRSDGKEVTVMPNSCTSRSWQPTQGAGPATRGTQRQGQVLHWARGSAGKKPSGHILQQKGANTKTPIVRVSLKEAKESFFCQ